MTKSCGILDVKLLSTISDYSVSWDKATCLVSRARPDWNDCSFGSGKSSRGDPHL